MMEHSTEILSLPLAGPDPVQRDLSLAEVVTRIRSHAGRGMLPGPARAYSQVSAVYACVKAKADALSQMPMMVSTVDDEVIESGPLVQLVECPNPKMTGRQFRRNVSAFLDLFGRVHFVFTFAGTGAPIEVYPVSPLQMKPKVNERTGELEGWKFRPAGAVTGVEEFIPADEVHTIVEPDFEDVAHPFEGLGPRAVVARAISQLYKSDVANEASLDNGVEPGGALRTDQNLTQDQKREVREWLDDHHAGVANRRRYLLLEGGLQWQQMAATFADMEFTELKQMSRVDVCAAFSVPPPVVGFFTDSNYAHADASQQMFWINTVLPRGEWLAEEWTVGVINRFRGDRSLAVADARREAISVRQRCCHGYKSLRSAARRTDARFFAWFDSSRIPAVQKAQMQQADQAKTWIDKGVPLNQVIRSFDLPYEEQPWGDTWYKPLGLVDVQEDLLPGSEDPPGPPPPEGPEAPEAADSEQESERTGRRSVAASELRRVDESTRSRIWLQWRASWQSLERSARGKFNRHWHELSSDVLSNLNSVIPSVEGKSLQPDARRDVIDQILFNIVPANGKLLAKVGPIIREGSRLGGQQSMDEAAAAKGADEPDQFDMDAPDVQAKLRRREVKITGLNRRLQSKLRDSLAEGLGNGETQAQLAERVRQQFKQVRGRTNTIAMTEVGGAVEESRQEGRRQAGIPLKSWLWSRKETGRQWHLQTELNTIDEPIENDTEFTIAQTNNTAQHPRGSGVAEDDINCGCTTLSRFRDESTKAMLARYTKRGFLTYEQLTQRDLKRREAQDNANESPEDQ